MRVGPGAAGEKSASCSQTSPHPLERTNLHSNPEQFAITYRSCLSTLLVAVSGLRLITVGIFRTGGGGDAVDAGRHPPADGRTPETATQRPAATVLQQLQPLHAGGKPKSDEKRAPVVTDAFRYPYKLVSN
ncbi:hypothetical protein CRENBAI_016854 [Crenichthys baileyi]|uniref:Uncharacterized protein n=1 Tax=Crenichthys baileyi TaxID=28760 RepID=A0AAV9SCG7_9TELE